MLSIGKGTTLIFGKGAGIEVDPNGSLIAHGNADALIKFTRDSMASNWGSKVAGIMVKGGYSSTGQTSLTYCIIENATTGLYDSCAMIDLSYCTVRNCSNEGIAFWGEGSGPRDSASFLNNTITGNGGYPLSMWAISVEKLSGTGNFTGNGKDGIRVYGGEVFSKAIWRKHNVPYVILGNLSFAASIEVEMDVCPGCRLEFAPDEYHQPSGIGIGEMGTLIAHGTPTDSIVFTRSLMENGSNDSTFTGISIYAGVPGQSSLTYCIVENASTAISASVPVEISNCTIRNCLYKEIVFSPDYYFSTSDTGCPKDSASFLNNTITGCGDYAISILANRVGRLSGMGDFSGNSKNGILVLGAPIGASAIWKKHSVPYVIDGEVDVGSLNGATLTIRPDAA